MISRNLHDFAEAARERGIALGSRELQLFTLYDEGLRLWNQKMNLISKGDIDQLPIRHFLDAITPVPFLPRGNFHLLDIGSGSGLPGIPLKIVMGEWRLTLLEASRKRASFLKDMVRRLGLQDVTVIHDRTDELIRRVEGQGAYDAVISRATFKLPQLVETASYFLRAGGMLVAMKGNVPEAEWDESIKICNKVDISIKETHEFSLPPTNMQRKIIIYNKSN